MERELESHRARVLVAEDDDDTRCVIVAGLRCDGHEVLEATNGLELLEVATRGMASGRPPDIIVSDLRMPFLSGVAAVEALRKSASQVPVVLLSAYGTEETEQRARELGVGAFLHKPIDLYELRALVGVLLRGAKR